MEIKIYFVIFESVIYKWKCQNCSYFDSVNSLFDSIPFYSILFCLSLFSFFTYISEFEQKSIDIDEMIDNSDFQEIFWQTQNRLSL